MWLNPKVRMAITTSTTLAQSMLGLELAFVDDGDVEWFIFVKDFLLVDKCLGVGKVVCVDEDASLRVFGFGAHMDAYSGAVGDVADLG